MIYIMAMNKKANEFNLLGEPAGRLPLWGYCDGKAGIAVTSRPVVGSIPTSSTIY